MKILSIETSCDETSVAIVEDGRKILTDQIYTQIAIHRKYGGVVPEIASRNHVIKLPISMRCHNSGFGCQPTADDALAVDTHLRSFVRQGSSADSFAARIVWDSFFVDKTHDLYFEHAFAVFLRELFQLNQLFQNSAEVRIFRIIFV